MLIKGDIPTSEPTVSIGLVLPEDQKVSLKVIDLITNTQFVIDESFDGQTLPKSTYELKATRAGRGFHWEKEITIKTEGELEIKFVEGFLFITNHILLEKYLVCVATSEMSGHCPPALLEAQTIAARSWLLAAQEQKHANLGLDACNDDCCQRYQGIGNVTKEAKQAVSQTRGNVLMYDNQICDTRYSKSCGGMSEHNEYVWHDSPKPYLRGIVDGEDSPSLDLTSENELSRWIEKPPRSFCGPDFIPESQLKKYLGHVDKSGHYFRWDMTYSQSELTQLISEKTGREFDTIESLQPLNRGVSGRITLLRIQGISNRESVSLHLKSEYEIRRVLHPKFLFSSAFIIEANSTPNAPPSQVTFKGAGWGHGVGLCQIGALGMALDGYATSDILSHYFQSIELKKIYD